MTHVVFRDRRAGVTMATRDQPIAVLIEQLDTIVRNAALLNSPQSIVKTTHTPTSRVEIRA
jgi:hypothetical protein